MRSAARRRGHGALVVMLVLVLAPLGWAEVEAGPQHPSVGTLVTCQGASAPSRCLWAAEEGRLVEADEMRKLLVDKFMPSASIEKKQSAARRLDAHMRRMEDVRSYADAVGHKFSYDLGVNKRHLTADWAPDSLSQVFVHREVAAAKSRTRSRRLDGSASAAAPSNTSTGASWGASHDSLDWCSTNNPAGRSICSAVKSQANCGSCWAFAAVDAIESAVVIAANLSKPVVLSVQQLLSCSNRDTENTFTYCWARDRPALLSSAPWLSDSIRWKSENEGCNGGMTHGAFMDAAQLHFGLLPEIAMPYVDYDGNVTTPPCIRSSNLSVASIATWAQVAGTDCMVSNDQNVLLRKALETQPIAVAINSADYFKDYKGGFYTCPNQGDILTKDQVNHALVLVGYGTDPTQGDYWILKNSYGSAWGDKGFMKLLADHKLNCGLNIFPVVPLGAAAKVSTISVDGGGSEELLGVSPSGWITIAIAVAIATVVLTIVGVIVNHKRRHHLRDQVSGDLTLQAQILLYE